MQAAGAAGQGDTLPRLQGLSETLGQVVRQEGGVAGDGEDHFSAAAGRELQAGGDAGEGTRDGRVIEQDRGFFERDDLVQVADGQGHVPGA